MSHGNFNVKDFGAKGDGVTDDTAAFKDALLAAGGRFIRPGNLYVPPGIYYLTDDLRLNSAMRFYGPGGPTSDVSAATLKFIAGRGLIVENQYGSSAGRGALVENLAFLSTMLTLPERVSNATANVGDLVRSPRHDDNRYYFKCIKSGTTALAGAIPDFRNGYVPDTSVAWTALTAVPMAYQVQDTSVSTNVIWQVTTPGTTGASTPTWNVTPGATTTDGTVVWTAAAPSGAWFQDGTAWWACKTHSAIWVKCPATIRDCKIDQFTNCGIWGQDNRFIGAGNLDYTMIDGCRITGCGVGIALRGYDGGQGGVITRCSIYTPGYYWGGPPNTGGHGIWDGSFLGVTILGCNVQGNNGYAYIWGQYDVGVGAGTNPFGATVIGCYSEGDGLGRSQANGGVVLGGDFGSVNLGTGTLMCVSGGMKNLYTIDTTDVKHTTVTIDNQGSGIALAIQNDDNLGLANALGVGYEVPALQRTGWWSRTWGGGQTYAGRSWSGKTATEGIGWEWQPVGEFRGGYRGVFSGQYFCGLDSITLTSSAVRGGNFQVGDRFELQNTTGIGTYTGYLCTTAGPRAQPWLALRAYGLNNLVEPTANGYPIPVTGGKVFKCTTAGTTAAGEPNWASAPNIGNTVTDGTVTWTNVGVVPTYARIGRIDDRTDGVDGGQLAVAMADANQTLTATQSTSAGIIKFTGANTAIRTATFPTPTSAYKRFVRNATTGGFAITVGCGVGATVNIANGLGAWIGFDTAGTFRMGPDT